MERDRLSSQVAALRQRRADDADRQVSMASRVRELEAQLASLTESQAELEAGRKQLAKRFNSMARILGRLGEANRNLLASLENRTRERDDLVDRVTVLARLDERAADSVDLMRRVVGMTGLDVDQMLDRLGAPVIGRGGPFIAFASGEPASLLESQIDELDLRLDQWQGLRELVESMPLTAPLDGYQFTSHYGSRTDPFTGRRAMHEGTDFIGKSRAPILATAPGKVTFVGLNGGYGKMVEVDHGLGIRTRYGHMRKIYVKRGQAVDFRQRLGQMGETGRSTAEHLHYEVLIDGVPVDPENFLRAGVFAFSG